MKQIILILLITITQSFADYSSSGSASSRGEAYIEAMSNAPSGTHWVLNSINYHRGYLDRYTCIIVWKQK